MKNNPNYKIRYIYTTGCGPCTQITPYIELITDFEDDIEMVLFNDYQENVHSVPFKPPVRQTPEIHIVSKKDDSTIISYSAQELSSVIQLIQTKSVLSKFNSVSEFISFITKRNYDGFEERFRLNMQNQMLKESNTAIHSTPITHGVGNGPADLQKSKKTKKQPTP